MKITIKKFMELSNVTIQTPAKIEAGHDVGKSTIFRAVLFAITGKDVDGKEFDGRIYPKAAKNLSDLSVEVEIEHNGVVFCKKATGGEKRQKGSDQTDLQRSVTSTYLVDYQVVTKSAYEEKISEVFGNFQLFCNPDHFRNLDKNEKRKIFASLVNIDKNSYFAGLPDKKTISGKISAQKTEIDRTIAKIQELSQVAEPESIEVVDYSRKLQELRKKRADAVPILTDDQVRENNEIRSQVEAIQSEVFTPKPFVKLPQPPDEPSIVDVNELNKKMIALRSSEPDTSFIDTQITRMKAKISNINALTLQVENYDENVRNSKCVLCQVCASPDCAFKRVEIDSLDELKNKLSSLMPLNSAEQSLLMLENEKIKYLRDFENLKESEIASLSKKIAEASNDNAIALIDYVDQKKVYDEQVEQIKAQNSKIAVENSEKEANFQVKKSERISELLGKIHKLPDFDYSEIDAEILAVEKLNYDQQLAIDEFNKAVGAHSFAMRRVDELNVELSQLKSELYSLERELIRVEDAETRYYTDFERKINNEMPENVRVRLFKKNLSNDDYSEVFEIEFNGSIYAGNGKTIAFYIWLCSWFQTKFEKDLPIFIDEAIILNEKLYSEVKNVVILMRNDECKQLKISEL